jgi:hypothetical protein
MPLSTVCVREQVDRRFHLSLPLAQARHAEVEPLLALLASDASVFAGVGVHGGPGGRVAIEHRAGVNERFVRANVLRRLERRSHFVGARAAPRRRDGLVGAATELHG